MSKRATILRAATRAFGSKGFRETSTTELAEMTGVAEGTVFYHFGNKEKLFLEVLDNVRREIEGEFSEYLKRAAPESGLRMLEEAVAFHLELAEKKPELFLILHRFDAFELARADEQFRSELEAIFSCLVSVYEGALERGMRDGSVAKVSTRRTALLIFNMVDGLVRFRDWCLFEPAAMFPEVLRACRALVGPDSSTE